MSDKMAKISNKKVTKEIEKRIIELHLQGLKTYEISSQIFTEEIDLSTTTINTIINKYYDSIGEKRIKRPGPKPKTAYTIEEIEEQLLQQLKKGRPVEEVYKVSKKMNCLTDKLLSEIKRKGYIVPDKKEEGNER